jgi:hypothetical protein
VDNIPDIPIHNLGNPIHNLDNPNRSLGIPIRNQNLMTLTIPDSNNRGHNTNYPNKKGRKNKDCEND